MDAEEKKSRIVAQVQVELNDHWDAFWKKEQSRMPRLPQGTYDMLRIFGQTSFLEGANKSAELINVITNEPD